MPKGTLRGLGLGWRVLVTGFLLVLGLGYLMGALNAALAVGLTPASIAGHYRDQTLTPAEAAVVAEQGFVEEEFSFDDLDDGGGGADGADGTHGKMEHGAPGPVTGGGESISAQQLAQLAHVHLLGFAFILLSVGALACLTGWPEGIKALLVGVLALSLVVDIGGLWLVRFVSDGFAWLTAAGGVGIGLCLGATAARVLWEVWGPGQTEGWT